MKTRTAAVTLVSLVALAIVWRAVHAQGAPAVIPFASGISVPATSGAGITLFARQPDNTYSALKVGVTAPYSLLSSASTVTQLLAGGESRRRGCRTSRCGSAIPKLQYGSSR